MAKTDPGEHDVESFRFKIGHQLKELIGAAEQQYQKSLESISMATPGTLAPSLPGACRGHGVLQT